MLTPPLKPDAPWRAGVRAARATLVPGIALQVAAVSLVLAYYRSDAARSSINTLAELHERMGILFGVISTAIFGGLIPFLYLKARPQTRAGFTWSGGAALTAFWAYKGFEVDAWYHLQAWLVGAENDVGTIAIKTFLDQFVYCPFLAVPVTVLVIEWIYAEFRFAPIAADIRAGGWYRRRVLHVLISNLGVWIPAVCIIYALPTALQLPLQNLVLCFWTILLAHIMPRREAALASLMSAGPQ